MKLKGDQLTCTRGEREVFRGLSFGLSEGEAMLVTGRNGAGKSTLLHIVGALDRVSSGTVRFNGLDLSHMEDQVASNFRNSTVGFIFQMNNLLQEFSAIENVMMPGLIAGIAPTVARQRATEMLQAVGLQHRAEHRPGELSGGEQQRVAIACALLMSPPILLADEPTGNLDNKTSREIQELLLGLCKELNMTMLLVTHDLELANRLPHRIVMDDGQVIDRGIF